MKRVSVLGLVTVVMLADTTSHAGQCGDLLRFGIRNKSKSTTQGLTRINNFDSLCRLRIDKMTDAQARQAGASYGLFSANYGDARQRLRAHKSTYCSKKRRQKNDQQLSQSESSVVSAELVAAYNECLKLQRGIRVQFNVNADHTMFTLGLSLRIGVGGGSKTCITGIEAFGPFDCKGGLKKQWLAASKAQKFCIPLTQKQRSITCQRRSTVFTRGNSTYRRYEKGHFAVHTHHGNYVIDFLGFEKPDADMRRIAAFEKRLSRLEKALRLDCKLVDKAVGAKAYASATARLSSSDLAAGYRRSGGGCRAWRTGSTHNAFLMENRPDGADGWLCKIGDPPNIPTPLAVRAWVVGCRVLLR